VYSCSCGTSYDDMKQAEGFLVMLRTVVQRRNIAVVYRLTFRKIKSLPILRIEALVLDLGHGGGCW
jgi:hypothetical protein